MFWKLSTILMIIRKLELKTCYHCLCIASLQTNLTREEEIYKQEVIRLEKDLADLESSVEGLRGEVINRRTRVNMVAVEDMALVLSRAR